MDGGAPTLIFPPQIDNTMRSEFMSCQRSWMLRFLRHKAGPLPSVHLHAGAAFARGLEVARRAFYDEGKPMNQAVALGWHALLMEYGDFEPNSGGSGAVKSAHRMGEALVAYFDEYPMDTDPIRPLKTARGSAVEFTFSIPLPIAHPETGDPLLYSGRFDMLGESGGQLFVVDEKTTGSLGEYWLTRYAMSAQFTGYCWAAKQFGYPVVGAIIRGVGILKTKISHAAIPLMRQDWLIDEWYDQMLRDVHAMVECYKTNRFAPNFADSCGAYGGCDYLPVCQVPPGASRESMLAINYVEREWIPVQGEDLA